MGLRRALRRLALAAVALFVVWAVVTHPAPPKAYCGPCAHGSYSTRSGPAHPHKRLRKAVTGRHR